MVPEISIAAHGNIDSFDCALCCMLNWPKVRYKQGETKTRMCCGLLIISR